MNTEQHWMIAIGIISTLTVTVLAINKLINRHWNREQQYKYGIRLTLLGFALLGLACIPHFLGIPISLPLWVLAAWGILILTGSLSFVEGAGINEIAGISIRNLSNTGINKQEPAK